MKGQKTANEERLVLWVHVILLRGACGYSEVSGSLQVHYWDPRHIQASMAEEFFTAEPWLCIQHDGAMVMKNLHGSEQSFARQVYKYNTCKCNWCADTCN